MKLVAHIKKMNPTEGPPTLQALCLSNYLRFLEAECQAFLSLKRGKSKLLRDAANNILPVLRLQLTEAMSGTSSSVLRGLMMKEIVSGIFPSEEYKNVIKTQVNEEMQVNADPKAKEFVRNICTNSSKCVSMCCTGAFIIETMLSVVINDEIKELVFDPDVIKKTWKKGGVGEYVPFNYPALLGIYTDYIETQVPRDENFALERSPALETLKIGRFDYVLSKDSSWKVLKSSNKTKEYLDYLKYCGPEWSWDRVISDSGWTGENSSGYLPTVDHAIWAVTEMFTPPGLFTNLVDISLSWDLATNFCPLYGIPMFTAMGGSCPNLKVLDLSDLTHLRGESILYLLFQDTFHTVHHNMYLYPYKNSLGSLQDFPLSLCFDEEDISTVRKHCYTRYCPWCKDPGALDTLRSGCHNNPVVFSVVDDQLYDWVENCEVEDEDLRKQALVYTVRASDMFHSVARTDMQLYRDKKDRPYRIDYKPPNCMENAMEIDGGFYSSFGSLVQYDWYPPPDNIEYVELDKDEQTPKLNPLAASLQVLKLPALTVKAELVPVILKACPKIRSFGQLSGIPYGLEQISKMGEETFETNLEEIFLYVDMLDDIDWKDTPDYDDHFGSRDKISTNSPNVGFISSNFGRKIFKPITALDDEDLIKEKHFALRVWKEAMRLAPERWIEKRLKQYVDNIHKYAKKLRKLTMFLTSAFEDDLDHPEDIWKNLNEMKYLEELDLKYARIGDVSGLIQIIGKKLKKFTAFCIPSMRDMNSLILEQGLGIVENNENSQTEALIICENCPNLEELNCGSMSLRNNFHFGRQMVCQPQHFSRLRYVSVGRITLDTLKQIWSLTHVLETLRIEQVLSTPQLTVLSSSTNVNLTMADIRTLLLSNKMRKLESIRAFMLMFENFAAAKFFIGQLPALKDIGKVFNHDISWEGGEGPEAFFDFEDFAERMKEERGMTIRWRNGRVDDGTDDQ